jgi:spermidine synthase
MATGISAGAALVHPVERVVICELIPEVVTAAQRHFSPYVEGLFHDPRAQIVIDDGRNYLLATEERFDVIIGDLFRPWGSGIGDLYTLEHFQTIQSRLAPDGLYVQWLPLYQLSQREFGIIARTMLEIFPQVTLWRGNFVPNKPIVALLAQKTAAPLNPITLNANVTQLLQYDPSIEIAIDALVSTQGYPMLALNPESKPLLVELLPQLAESVPYTFYAGNLSSNQELFSEYPINRDDLPLLEFLAPKTRSTESSGLNPWLTGLALESFFGELASRLSPEEDPYLQNLSEVQLHYVAAGLSYFRSHTYALEGQTSGDAGLLEQSQAWMDDYLKKMGLSKPPN